MSVQSYRPYPIEKIDELQKLCRVRAKAKGKRRKVLERQIVELTRQLKDYGLAQVGDTVAGARLDEMIDQGEFGTVWKAYGANGEICAVKVIHPYRLGQGQMMRRFRRGVAAMRSLKEKGHPPSIISWHDSEDGDLAFQMNFISNGDLSTLMDRRWSFDQRLRLFESICEAVDFAHRHDVIHRDIKPANILIDDKNCPVLADFDLADLVRLGAMTQDQRGTPRYAAPEQLDPPEGQVEPPRLRESDIFSLGRVLQFLITEKEPSVHPPTESELSRMLAPRDGLNRVVLKCTQREPGKRYATVALLLDDLRLWRTHPESVGGSPGNRLSLHEPVPLPDPEHNNRAANWMKWGAIATVSAGLLAALATVLGSFLEAAATRDGANIQVEGARQRETYAPLKGRAFPSPPAPPPKNEDSQSETNGDEKSIAESQQTSDHSDDTPLSPAAAERQSLWYSAGMGRRLNQDTPLPLIDKKVIVREGSFLIGQFECEVTFDENGNPSELRNCVGRGDVRTQEPLKTPVNCVLHSSRRSTSCTSDEFSYSNSGVFRHSQFVLSVQHR